MEERIAVIDGLRTPLGKMGGALSHIQADMLGTNLVNELYNRFCDYDLQLSEVIMGNVSQPAHAQNIARVIALRTEIPQSIPAYTVHRNCASGFESITSASCKILAKKSQIILAGGVESMSNVPFIFSDQYKKYLENFMRLKSTPEKLKHLLKFKLKFLKPIIGLKLGLTDPTCNMIMGDTAEILAREFSISRNEQDKFACASHNKAEKATKEKIFENHILAIANNPKSDQLMTEDEGIRNGQNMKDLAKLKPFFDRKNGTVTAANSSQITDGAAGVILMTESQAKKHKIKPLGFIKDFCYQGLDPKRMGLGPAYSIAKILEANKLKLNNIDLFEINEAFAAQVIACRKALDSTKFCQDKLSLNKKLGLIDDKKLNIYGGAIAVGHPVGMTGTRLIIQLLHALKNKKKQTAIASLCIGGGQGGAILLEAN
tara:strand:- start:1470 stop:2759 length:1290 start_codon:yes stop_codon:yes gene_type:complete